jgi:hypothetical protein
MMRHLSLFVTLLLCAGCDGSDAQPPTVENTVAESNLWSVTYDRILKRHGDDVQLNEISKPQQVVLAVVNSDGILGNGGFQYLFEGNFPGDPEFLLTREAYKTIGATDLLKKPILNYQPPPLKI